MEHDRDVAFYFVIAVAGALVAFCAQRLESKNRVLAFIFYLVLVALFCHFAGMRGIDVGTDTSGYGYNSYVLASQSSLGYFFGQSQYSTWSPLYKLLLWFTCECLGGFYWCLFVIQLFTIVPTLIACRRLSGDHFYVAVFCYAVLFYPMSFNMMRQMVSMGFVLLSYRFVEERRVVPFACVIAVAVGFHGSAILGAVIYPLAHMSRPKTVSGGLKLAALVVVSSTFMLAAPWFLSLAASVGFYDAYVTGSSIVEGGGLRTICTTAASVAVLGFFGALFLKVSVKDGMPSCIPLAAIVIFGAICLSLSLISLWLYRVGFYYLYFSLLLIPRLCGSIDDRQSRAAFVLAVVFVASLWSFDYYVLQGSHEVVPYVLSSYSL